MISGLRAARLDARSRLARRPRQRRALQPAFSSSAIQNARLRPPSSPRGRGWLRGWQRGAAGIEHIDGADARRPFIPARRSLAHGSPRRSRHVKGPGVRPKDILEVSEVHVAATRMWPGRAGTRGVDTSAGIRALTWATPVAQALYRTRRLRGRRSALFKKDSGSAPMTENVS